MTTRSEPRWTDLPPEERARRLRQPLTIQRIGSDKSWGGANLQDKHGMPATRGSKHYVDFDPMNVSLRAGDD